MNTYIALLRGINVGGHKKILMANLKSHLEHLNFKSVQTYIQSGNIVFQSTYNNVVSIENAIKNQILKQYGFEVPVLVKTKLKLKSIFDDCPFAKDKKENSYFIMLHSEPESEVITEIQKLSSDDEEFVITSSCIYIFYSLGAGKAKLGTNWFEKKLKTIATARNYRTMVKLLEMTS